MVLLLHGEVGLSQLERVLLGAFEGVVGWEPLNRRGERRPQDNSLICCEPCNAFFFRATLTAPLPSS